MFKKVFLFFLEIASAYAYLPTENAIKRKIDEGIAPWMQQQLDIDFAYFKNRSFSLEELEEFYERRGDYLQLVKITLENNHVDIDKKFVHPANDGARYERYRQALQLLCQAAALPNTTFLLSVNDGLNVKEGMPIFAMCKKDSNQIILLPDYEALGSRYQVLKEGDITKNVFPWETKREKLIWRGSTAQLWTKITENNLHLFSRIKLCELSQTSPEWVDAKFTIFAQGGEKIPYLKQFKGERLSYEEQLQYKYHILIDGNTCPYSTSGWKFFGNSLICKPDSDWIQWYTQALIPYVHYIPVRQDLSDLVEKLLWSSEHDDEARKIAENCREFALSHITIMENLTYLYFAIQKYCQRFILD